MNWHVGQKVVCVDDAFDPDSYDVFSELPKRNRVYVIRELETGCTCTGTVGLYLVGIFGAHAHCKCGSQGETSFVSTRFRPLDEMKEETRQRNALLIPTTGCINRLLPVSSNVNEEAEIPYDENLLTHQQPFVALSQWQDGDWDGIEKEPRWERQNEPFDRERAKRLLAAWGFDV